MTHQLSQTQKDSYHENGYLIGLPAIYTRDEMAGINRELPSLLNLLQPGETSKDIREWHETSTYLYDIVMNPKIHDLVEGILGPNFFAWASSFFIKIIPGSQKHGLIKHRRSTATDSVLTLELETGTFSEDTAVSLCLKAGEISLHDDRAVHGSPANPSARRRAGLTIRYSGTIVKNDMTVNPNFKTYLCRGVDDYQHNPTGPVPTQRFARPAFKAVSVEEAGVDPTLVHAMK